MLPAKSFELLESSPLFVFFYVLLHYSVVILHCVNCVDLWLTDLFLTSNKIPFDLIDWLDTPNPVSIAAPNVKSHPPSASVYQFHTIRYRNNHCREKGSDLSSHFPVSLLTNQKERTITVYNMLLDIACRRQRLQVTL